MNSKLLVEPFRLTRRNTNNLDLPMNHVHLLTLTQTKISEFNHTRCSWANSLLVPLVIKKKSYSLTTCNHCHSFQHKQTNLCKLGSL